MAGSIRVEVILSDVDFEAGKILMGTATIAIGQFIQIQEWTNASGPIGTGGMIGAEMLADEAFPHGATASGTVVCTNDSSCQIGAIVSFADSPASMPASQRADI